MLHNGAPIINEYAKTHENKTVIITAQQASE